MLLHILVVFISVIILGRIQIFMRFCFWSTIHHPSINLKFGFPFLVVSLPLKQYLENSTEYKMDLIVKKMDLQLLSWNV